MTNRNKIATYALAFIAGFGFGNITFYTIAFRYMLNVTEQFYGPDKFSPMPSHIKKQIELINDDDDAGTRETLLTATMRR